MSSDEQFRCHAAFVRRVKGKPYPVQGSPSVAESRVIAFMSEHDGRAISQFRRPAVSFTDKHAAYPFALEFREYGQRPVMT